jgi:hypothetical protein
MAPSTPSLALVLLLPMVLLRPSTAIPAPLAHRAGPDVPQPTYSCAEDAVDCNRPFDASVYICENMCVLFTLSLLPSPSPHSHFASMRSTKTPPRPTATSNPPASFYISTLSTSPNTTGDPVPTPGRPTRSGAGVPRRGSRRRYSRRETKTRQLTNILGRQTWGTFGGQICGISKRSGIRMLIRRRCRRRRRRK